MVFIRRGSIQIIETPYGVSIATAEAVLMRKSQNIRKNKMTITVKIKNVFGTDKIYPVCDKAKTFARLTETKTLTSYAINNIKALGYTIEVQAQTL